MGEGKPLGPLLHFTSLLPFIMKNYHTFPDSLLRKKYRGYPQALWPCAFSCFSNVKANSANREGKINVPQSYKLQALT
jgi:hypothetical protein